MSDASKTAVSDEPHKILEDGAAESASEQEKTDAAQQLSTPTKDGQLSMSVKVHSPFREYYNGTAFSLSAENVTGPFDILPGHHNFISLLSPCELVVRTGKGEQKIQIAGGIIHVKANETIVFLDV